TVAACAGPASRATSPAVARTMKRACTLVLSVPRVRSFSDPARKVVNADTLCAMHRLSVGALAGLLATLLATAAASAAPAPTDTQLPIARCDPIDPAVCLQPWPNDFFTVEDKTTDTGRRLNLDILGMPRNIAGKPIDP